MPDSTSLLDSFSSATETGRYFVALADRTREGRFADEWTKPSGEKDAATLAHNLLLSLPLDLRGASIEILEDGHVIAPDTKRTLTVVTYPPVLTSGSDTAELGFSRCFKVCTVVQGAKVCGEVCVNVDVGFSGISGSVSATVSVSF